MFLYIKCKHFPHYWPFVRGIPRSPVNSPHKGQWHGALMFSLICVWINGWVKNREAGDLRHHHAHYDVTVMGQIWMAKSISIFCYVSLKVCVANFQIDANSKSMLLINRQTSVSLYMLFKQTLLQFEKHISSILCFYYDIGDLGEFVIIHRYLHIVHLNQYLDWGCEPWRIISLWLIDYYCLRHDTAYYLSHWSLFANNVAIW